MTLNETNFASLNYSLGDLLPSTSADLNNTGPFVDEEEYWSLVGAMLCTRHQWNSTKSEVESMINGSNHVISTSERHLEVLQNLLLAKAELGQHLDCLRDTYRSRCEKTSRTFPAPRILRLKALAGLSEPEIDTLHYLVLATCHPDFGDWRGMKYEAGEIASFFGFEPLSFFILLDSTSALLRHGLVSAEKRIVSSHRTRDLKIGLSMVKILRGLALSEEDGCAVNAGLIREILEEEPPETLPASIRDDLEGEVTTNGESRDSSDWDADDADDLDDNLEIEELLRAPAEEPETPAPHACSPEGDDEALPYGSDLEYLNDHLTYFRKRAKWRKIQAEDEDLRVLRREDVSPEIQIRQAQIEERVVQERIRRRLAATETSGARSPRAERLARMRRLDTFEKNILLFLAGRAASIEFTNVLEKAGSPSVGDLLYLFFDSLEEQTMGRKYFYRDAPLVRDGLIRLESLSFSHDILRADVEMDRRMVDYLLGLESENYSLVEGSHLYSPKVSLDAVIIPETDKELIVNTVERFPSFCEERRRSGMEDILTYGAGLVLLFYGPSGTGKTMMANALASHLGKRILLVNYPTIGTMTSDETLNFLFREAKIHDAIVFFDECEGIFEDRGHNQGISLILSELERHDGLVIMATNRPLELDEAMHRRITLAVEFRPPDATHREQIWRAHIPSDLRLESTPPFAELAYRWELTGGLIKNAVISALALASGRDSKLPVVRPADLEEGARLQMRGRFQMQCFEDRVLPRCGISDVVLPDRLRQALNDLIGLEKARRTLVGHWGFAEEAERGMGTAALFFGAPGTGKTLAAEAVAYELGRPLKRVNVAQVVSRWVGEGPKNIEGIFREARQSDAVLVFDEADALFASRTAVSNATDRYANLEVAVMLREMERYPGVTILTSNLADNIDRAFHRRLGFILEFPAPAGEARLELWRRHLPAQTPLAPDVELEPLAEKFSLTGGQIRNAVLKAAAVAALRAEPHRQVTHGDLWQAAEDEYRSNGNGRVVGFSREH